MKLLKELTKARLERKRHDITDVDIGHQGFIMATSYPYDVVVIDVQMPHQDGFMCIDAMRHINNSKMMRLKVRLLQLLRVCLIQQLPFCSISKEIIFS